MRARLALTWQESLFSVVVTAITLAGTALVLIVGGMRVLDGTLTVGTLLVVIAYLAAVYAPLSAIAHTAGSLQQAIVSARRVRETLALAPERLEDPEAMDASAIAGCVRFEDVSFSYDGVRTVLDDISFEARPGEVVALVGLTGAGKTTLTNLIPRFYEPTRGRILIDGIEAQRYALRSLRERIALVPQDPVLLRGTIADNIRYGRLQASDDEVRAAARAAHVDEFVQRLPGGYETRVEEAGATLSGGERQRIGIARALLKNAPLLILDEPTSSVDALSEAAIFDALRSLRRGRTTIVIAHRLSTVRDATRILVLHEGRLIAQGTHDELLVSTELYRRLWARLAAGPSGARLEPSPSGTSAALDAHAAPAGMAAVKILFAGIIARHPFGGVTWCSLMYLLGLRALGHEVFYIEDTGECIYDPAQNAISTDPAYGTAYIHRALEPFGLGTRWSFVNYDGTYHGASRAAVQAWCRDADLFVNLSGGSWFWRDEYAAIPRRVFVDSDPVFTQLAIAKGEEWYVEFFRGFDRLFTFGANIGTPACDVPVGEFVWHHTWQPVTIDLWQTETPPRHDRFTTVMSWTTGSFTDVDGNKEREFVRFLDLPGRAAQRFALAVNGPHDLLAAHGWSPVDGMSVSRSLWDYREFIQARGRSSASRNMRTWPTARAGSAIGRRAISPPAGRRSCRRPAGALTCRRGRVSSRFRPWTRRWKGSTASMATTPGMPGAHGRPRASTSTRGASCRRFWRPHADDRCRRRWCDGTAAHRAGGAGGAGGAAGAFRVDRVGHGPPRQRPRRPRPRRHPVCDRLVADQRQTAGDLPAGLP
jgi:ABC-type multidrug transport system ATPase subunit